MKNLVMLLTLFPLLGCVKGRLDPSPFSPVGEGPAQQVETSGGECKAGCPAPPAGSSTIVLASSCVEALTANVAPYGAFWLKHVDQGLQVYCENNIHGNGWAMVFNSVLGPSTTDFWKIAYADRLKRKGSPAIDRNFYDGSLYLAGTRFLDIIEDINGKSAAVLVADSGGLINTETMKFPAPLFISGLNGAYGGQFAGGWSSFDRKGDAHPTANCATSYSNVSQHYGACWSYNLGSDAEGTLYDGGVGPHAHKSLLEPLALATDGTEYSRVRRITRFVKW